MFIQYGIVVITVLLLLHDNLKVFDNFGDKTKKITFYVLIGVLFILSVINIVTEEREQSRLMTQVEGTHERTKAIVEDVDESLSTIKEAKDEIVIMDSIINIVQSDMSVQIHLLDSAVIKSKEMLRLKQLDFELDKPEIIVFSQGIMLNFDTINKNEKLLNLSFIVQNNGKRTAIDLKENILLVGETFSKEYVLHGRSGLQRFYAGNLIGDLKAKLTGGISLPIEDIESFSYNTKRILFIIKISYADELSGKPYSKRFIFSASRNEKGEFRVSKPSYEDINVCERIIRQEKFIEFLE